MSKTELLQNTEVTRRTMHPGFRSVRLATAPSYTEVCDIGKTVMSDWAVICNL